MGGGLGHGRLIGIIRDFLLNFTEFRNSQDIQGFILRNSNGHCFLTLQWVKVNLRVTVRFMVERL